MAQQASNRRVEQKPRTYVIRVGSHLDEHWTDWFDAEVTNLDGGIAQLVCPDMDQAALHGLLARCRDLNIPLLSVERAEEETGH